MAHPPGSPSRDSFALNRLVPCRLCGGPARLCRFCLQYETLSPDWCCVDFVAHPVVVSGGILILLALSLSPYILALGGLALVLTGGSLIPGPIRGILPGPLQQVSGNYMVTFLIRHYFSARGSKLPQAGHPGPCLERKARQALSFPYLCSR